MADREGADGAAMGEIMRIHTGFDQSSLEWLTARSGVVTASEMDNLLTPDFKVRTGETPKTYLYKKLAEKWRGGAIPSGISLDMEFGNVLEQECIPAFEFETGQKVDRVALITSDDGSVGCSPDGLIGDDSGLEAKCPRVETHLKYLFDGAVPKDYIVQVHASLYVTGRQSWRFVSYSRGCPMLILTVQRDEEIIGKIRLAVEPFLAELESKVKKLEEMAGTKRPEKYVFTPETKPAYAMGDDITP